MGLRFLKKRREGICVDCNRKLSSKPDKRKGESGGGSQNPGASETHAKRDKNFFREIGFASRFKWHMGVWKPLLCWWEKERTFRN